MISICIPAYSMNGRGEEMLDDLITSIQTQTFKDYEVVVSNPCSENHEVGRYRWVMGKEGAAANLNNAIDHACGDIIKPMFQDDKFMEPGTLQEIADVFDRGVSTSDTECPHGNAWDDCDSGNEENDWQCPLIIAEWIACTSHNEGLENYDFVPYPHTSLKHLREGENTYGCPSAIAWRKNDLRFDENLKWLFDCEFYARMAERYGVPTFVDTKVLIRQWEGQATRTICDGSQRIADANEVVEKYRDRDGAARV